MYPPILETPSSDSCTLRLGRIISDPGTWGVVIPQGLRVAKGFQERVRALPIGHEMSWRGKIHLRVPLMIVYVDSLMIYILYIYYIYTQWMLVNPMPYTTPKSAPTECPVDSGDPDQIDLKVNCIFSHDSNVKGWKDYPKSRLNSYIYVYMYIYIYVYIYTYIYVYIYIYHLHIFMYL